MTAPPAPRVTEPCEECASGDTVLDRLTADTALWHCRACRHTFAVAVSRQRP